ncbi:MAG: hypothetical protein JWQ96_2747 [Segetibacter sp.]|jgi:DNA-directed RNA polymerase subunit delta|nr:hypothetical protein [Segetibacter sp.]
MAAKSDKDLKSSVKKKAQPPAAKPSSATSKKKSEDEDVEDEEMTILSTAKKSPKASAKSAVNHEDDEVEVLGEFDDAEKVEEDEDWDPDFDEFDLPKGGSVKKAVGKKASKDEDEDDDFKIDDEFKDMFSKPKRGYDDEDDDY